MLPGDLVAERFRIERQIARGGMGTVYRAVDLHTDELAAVKTMLLGDEQSLERFVREARVLAELRHPGIVQYLAHGRTADGEFFLAMEWLEGEDLEERLVSRGLSVGESVRVVSQAAAALAVAHARRVVHRDLKPSNLFLVGFETERVKVLDFGVARLAGVDGLTGTGVAVGTPRYMAPEQAMGAKTVDARADVFALGAVLYRCLSGRVAFPGRTAGEVMLRLLNEDPPRVRELRPDVPAKLDDLVWRMLAKDPAQRPVDAAALLVEILGQERTPTPPGEGAPPAGEPTEDEQRAECVILVAGEAQGALRRVVAAHGGVAESVPGATAVTLPGQRVAIDQARLAARCALALRRELPGTALGLVIGRRRVRSAPLPSGVMAAAGDLMGASAGDGVRLDANVAALLDARFVVAGDGRGLLLRGELSSDDEARTLLGRPSPYVGRDRDLAQLSAIFDGCVSDSEARAVLVTAAPGMGKSRLRQELTRRLPSGVEVWIGRGDPMRAGAPFGLLGEAVRRAAGIAGDEPPEERRRLLAARVGRSVPAGRAAQVTVFLGEMAGVPFPAEHNLQLSTARRDSRLLGDQMLAAFEAWLDAECQAHPVLIVLEDLHWGDAPTVRFIDAALHALRERPLMVLALARPEVKEQFPDLWSARSMQTISLGALSRRAAEGLVRQMLPDAAPETVARLVEHADGNAFYLEELLRRVAEGAEASLPDSVLAMVEARLQALPADARRVLRAGSIFGEVFWVGALRSLLGGSDAGASVDELTRRELIRRCERTRFAGEDEYRFRHGLIREAAYATLTDADRTVGHRLAGEWLETAGERDALALAEHFRRGERPDKAVTCYLRAAEQALAGNDMAQAIARAERGVAGGAAGEELGRLRLLQAEAYIWSDDTLTAQRAGLDAIACFPAGSPLWFMSVAEMVNTSGRMYDGETVRRLMAALRPAGGAELDTPEHAIAYARAARQAGYYLTAPEARELVGPLRAAHARFAGDARVVSWIAATLAGFVVLDVGIEESLELRARGVERVQELGDLRNACHDRAIFGAWLVHTGRLEEAEPMFREVLAIATELRLGVPRISAATGLAHVLLYKGEVAAAHEVAADAASRVPVGLRSQAVNYVVCLEAMALYRLGERARADEKTHQAMALVRPELVKPGLRVTPVGWVVAQVARLLVDLDHPDEADALLCAVPPDPGDDYPFSPAMHRARAYVSRALGDREGADRSLAQAWRLVQAQAEGIADPERRERFLDRGFGGEGLREEVRRWLGGGYGPT